MMASSFEKDGFKPCKMCTRTCFESHGDQGRAEAEQVLGAPSFLKLIEDSHLTNSSNFIRLPSMFMEEYRHRVGDVVSLRGPSGWVGEVNLSYDRGFGLRGAWKQFVSYHNIEAGDHILCTLIADSIFLVKIYNKYGCEKALPSLSPNPDTSSPNSEKGKRVASFSDVLNRKTEEGLPKSAPFMLGGKRKSPIEVESLTGGGKKLCVQQLGLEKPGIGNGNAESPTENDLTKPQAKSCARLESDVHRESPTAAVENRTTTPAQRRARSEERSSSDTEPGSADDDLLRDKEVRRKLHATEMKRFMAMEAAQAYETANPHTMLIVNKTSITKCQTYFSSSFARKWFPEERSQVLLVDEVGNKWPITFIPSSSSHMVLGAGWSKFVRDNNLEKGDVVVFELKNPNNITLLVHVFRVKDYARIKKSDDARSNTSSVGGIPTPSKDETLPGRQIENRSTVSIETEKSRGASDINESKSPPPVIPPQYAAVAQYFSSRRSAMKEITQRSINVETREGKKTTAANNSKGGAAPLPRQEYSPLVLPHKGGEPSLSTQRIEETVSTESTEIKTLFPPRETKNQGPAFVMAPIDDSEDKNLFPPGSSPKQGVSFMGQIPFVIPQKLGGQILMTPQGAVPFMMPLQEGGGVPFVMLQPTGPLGTFRKEENTFTVQPPPGLPKEVEFPFANLKIDAPTRSRERWEIKPRRPRAPTEAEKQRALDEAFEFWTPNPHVMVSLKPSQVYAGFSLTLRLAALPDETRDAILVDSTGQSWPCKWLVNSSGRRLSAGWKRFAVDHLLEEGDVCVFEMVDRTNLKLLIHIFRIELEDHASVPIEIVKSDGGRKPADPKKRKRKSRAKVRGLVPPVPKLPAYSGCRVEKLSGSTSAEGGANSLPTMPSYKYTALQSQRRPVTIEERRRAELAARNLNTQNPSVTVVMRNSCVYCHFLVSIPSAFAKQWLPRKLVRVTLWDSGGQKSTARWAGNRKKSACLKSFREFSLSHCLEEGDACVFELMDPNPNNPVFLVHVFRVVELPNTRIAPKEWEDHYKLDVMIGTVRALPPAEGNSHIQPLQSSQPLSITYEGNCQNPSGPSQAPKIPTTLAQLSPKSKTKAIYSAILRRKTRINEENGHPELLLIDQGEGSLREQEKSSHSPQSHIRTHGSDKVSHISQLEKLGRLQIARDMPFLKRMQTDGSLRDTDYTTYIHHGNTEPHGSESRLDMNSHVSQLEGETMEVIRDIMPLVTRMPKIEPVGPVKQPLERTKVRRKTTSRRDSRGDELVQITPGEPSSQDAENSAHVRPGNPEPQNYVQSHDMDFVKDRMPNVLRLPKREAVEEPIPPRTGGEYELLHTNQEEGNYQDQEHADQLICVPQGVESSYRLQSEDDVLPTLGVMPKLEPVEEMKGVGVVATLGSEAKDHPKSGQRELLRVCQGNGSLQEPGSSRRKFRQVFFGSVIDTGISETDPYDSDVEKEGLKYTRDEPPLVGVGPSLELRGSTPCGDSTTSWRYSSENECRGSVEKEVLSESFSWLRNHPGLRLAPLSGSPILQVKVERQEDEGEGAQEQTSPTQEDLNPTDVYMNGS